jgi:hypothetical protein
VSEENNKEATHPHSQINNVLRKKQKQNKIRGSFVFFVFGAA